MWTTCILQPVKYLAMESAIEAICRHRRELLSLYGVTGDYLRGMRCVGSGSHSIVFVCETWNPSVVFKFSRLPMLPDDDPLGLSPVRTKHDAILVPSVTDSLFRNEDEVDALDRLEGFAKKFGEWMDSIDPVDGMPMAPKDHAISPRLVMPPSVGRAAAMKDMAAAIAIVMERAYPLKPNSVRAYLEVVEIADKLAGGHFPVPHYDMHVDQFMCKDASGDPSRLVLVDWGGTRAYPTSAHFHLPPCMIYRNAKDRVPDIAWSAGCVILCLLCSGGDRFAFVNQRVHPEPRHETLAIAWARVLGHPPRDKVTISVLDAVRKSGAPVEPAASVEEFVDRVTRLHDEHGSMVPFGEARDAWDAAYKLTGRWQRVYSTSSILAPGLE